MIVAGCSGSGAARPTPEPAAIEMPVAEATAAELPVVEATTTSPAGPPFEAASYQNTLAGYQFHYPAGWFVGPVEQYSRCGITPLTSWGRPSDDLPEETPPGETRLDTTVQLWDPMGDLEAFVQQHVPAWEASGIAIALPAAWTLSDGRPARGFVVSGSDDMQAYSFFTTMAYNYLGLGGSGDLSVLSDIAHTVRPLF
jgi:hypothetical protein